jgi:hypothetical protein
MHKAVSSGLIWAADHQSQYDQFQAVRFLNRGHPKLNHKDDFVICERLVNGVVGNGKLSPARACATYNYLYNYVNDRY